MTRTKQLLIDIALSSALTLSVLPVIAAGPALSGEAGVGGTSGVRGASPSDAARSPGAELKSEGGVRMENTDMQTMPSTPSASAGTSGEPNTSGPTLADPAKSPIDFSSIDTNKDGKINVVEYLKQGGTRDSFRESDKNGDNKLDSSELMAQ